MKTKALKRIFLGALWLLFSQAALHAQQYSIDWFKVAGGGGSSGNAQYVLSGTIGQPDASSTLSGGSYSLIGGFWSIIAVQTTGAPVLTVFRTSTNTVVVAWPAPSSGFVLQQNTVLESSNWLNVTATRVAVGDQYEVIISPPTGNTFYRLKK